MLKKSLIHNAWVMSVVLALVPVATLSVARAAPVVAYEAVDCDRECLLGLVDSYMTALLAHDPERLPWAEHSVFTENNVRLRIGDGLWGTITAQRQYKQYVTDPQEGAGGFYGVVEESGHGAIFALRMKVHRHQIVEAETMVARKRPNEEF